MTEYTFYRHIDTGIEIKVKAENEDEALRLAQKEFEEMDEELFEDQLQENMQYREWELISEA